MTRIARSQLPVFTTDLIHSPPFGLPQVTVHQARGLSSTKGEDVPLSSSVSFTIPGSEPAESEVIAETAAPEFQLVKTQSILASDDMLTALLSSPLVISLFEVTGAHLQPPSATVLPPRRRTHNNNKTATMISRSLSTSLNSSRPLSLSLNLSLSTSVNSQPLSQPPMPPHTRPPTTTRTHTPAGADKVVLGTAALDLTPMLQSSAIEQHWVTLSPPPDAEPPPSAGEKTSQRVDLLYMLCTTMTPPPSPPCLSSRSPTVTHPHHHVTPSSPPCHTPSSCHTP